MITGIKYINIYLAKRNERKCNGGFNINISRQPAIKWAGSKRKQSKEIVKEIQKQIELLSLESYYEPFSGSLSILFEILCQTENGEMERLENYVVSDLNKELIECYLIIKDNYKVMLDKYSRLWSEMKSLHDVTQKKMYFNKIRSEYNRTKDPFLFFFIMRTCTNGLPRYNKKGEFNNTYHVNRDGIDPSRLSKILENWSYLLNKYDVKILNDSYENITIKIKSALYLDPPYANAKGMYFGGFSQEEFYSWLDMRDNFVLSYDGQAFVDDELILNNVIEVPFKHKEHILLNSGNSSFRRLNGSSENQVMESLYIKY